MVCGMDICWLCGTREGNNEILLREIASAAVKNARYMGCPNLKFIVCRVERQAA